VTCCVERLAHHEDQLGRHATRRVGAVALHQGAVGQRVGGVESHAPQAGTERLRDGQRGSNRVVLEVDEDGDAHLAGELARKGAGRRHRVAPVGGDEGMRDGADAPAAPPRGLGVGRDADRSRDMGRPAVAGLHVPVVVARGEVQDRLAACRLDDLADVAHDPRSSRQRPEVDRLEMGEEAVVAGDRHHRLPWGDLVALVQGVDLELVPSRLPGALGIPAP
jgi:hypothetical protein